MAKLIFFVFLWLLCVRFSNAFNATAYAPPSIVLDSKLIVEVEQEIRVGFRLFDASSLNKDSKTIKYQNLQYTSNPPNLLYPKVVANKDKLLFFGINGDDTFETTIMFSFDVNKGVWNELKDVNMPAQIYKEENFVGPDSGGNVYLLYNDYDIMFTFNVESLEWKEYIIQQQSFSSYYSWYTATLLSDGNIVYIGGKFVNDTGVADVPMNQVFVYDTTTNVWSSKLTTGTVPGPRNSHSASLTSDGKIIVYGGVTVNNQAASPDLVVLDTTTPNYSWSSPDVTNPIGAVYLTPSVIIDNFMFLYVGTNYSDANVPSGFNKVHMLDMSTYTWYSLDPIANDDRENIYTNNGSNNLASNDSNPDNKENIMITLIIVLIVITSLFTLSLLGITFYKCYRVRNHQTHPSPQKIVVDDTSINQHQV